MKKLESLKDDRFSKFETDKISNMISIKGGECHGTGNNVTGTCHDTAEYCDLPIYDTNGKQVGTRSGENDNYKWYALDADGKTRLWTPCVN